jgi:hypothetical protein
VQVSGSFTDPGAAGETYRGTAVVTRIGDTAEGTSVPLLVRSMQDAANPTKFAFDLPYAFTASGGYTIAFTVIDSQGGISDEKVVTVTASDGLAATGSAASLTAVSFTGAMFEVVKSGEGNLALAGSGVQAIGMVVENGTLVVGDPAAINAGTLRIASGGRVVADFAAPWLAGGAGTLSLAALSMEAGGVLDLGRGQIQVAAGGYDETQVREALARGRNGGGWDGATGIVSSAAFPGIERAVGYTMDGGQLHIGLAAAGDTNLDGCVDIQDVANMLAADRYNSTLEATWTSGDFNLDGIFDVRDVAAMVTGGLFDKGIYGVAEIPAGTAAAIILAGADVISGEAAAVEDPLSPVDAAFAGLWIDQQAQTTVKKKTRLA